MAGQWKRTRDSVCEIGKKKFKGLPNDLLTPYGIRHTYGADLRRLGVPVQEIATLMGHSRVTTTERYTRGDRDNLLSIVRDVDRAREAAN